MSHGEAPLILAFADLDDTLFQTLRKLPGHGRAALTPATVNTRGEAHSYCTPAQTALLDLLTAGAVTVIPVTGRDPAAMRRVTLPFRSWRVLDHGLTILTPAGELDSEWAAQVQAHLTPLQGTLTALTADMRAHADALGCRLTVHRAGDLPFMTVIKHPDADPEALAALQTRWEAAVDDTDGTHPLHVIANANNVSLLPRAPGKAQAVRWLRERHFPGAVLTLGLGDSVSDLPFLRECDFAVTPAQGQLLRATAGVRLPQR
ncbi:hypothetical protein [Deinococcus radiodurans]|uniref:Sucrose phosphatase-like domain-containing protein n=1 Tax=Deinococcus radiodurans (strain ATCC 13939 / DSM 20539 / JCM 16871 / CCUG 27074 / LMG 4051 / NBRC 15346 / NCIMB 9279 / VKM B-1422 / R1) TaxID=243230 RepID=Q9RSB0_DEIRA|nr:hypothetical protein [Deinococcus radiodurans]AAF11765.1 hypothetical protein DR_2215 [Deinococcus radiodurans R1 = ATCC 13939 = DSM 20539]ANC70724.1 hypothetical protein A2G07_02505 [Deinococcus radiodurans R1 = ATCC 13939 = DSM 20539]QEM71602.1 hypothetical protein DXG80_07390 [Deinococcus radiodurans]UDL01244.1 hypothetical protein E5E91_11460 [Deinococcus radiodurans R1 = ATCC 13939 = DSM 20539]UID71179.1 hypothetical protein DRO_2188 [Deinococcus radiodurans R1 = ATCC 13939 = DSM 20539